MSKNYFTIKNTYRAITRPISYVLFKMNNMPGVFTGLCIISCFLLFFVNACKLNSKKPSVLKTDTIVSIDFNDKLLQKYFYLSEFTDSIEYLKLETNDSCFLKKIDQLFTVKNELFISDGERLFVFNRNNGDFIRKIGKIGNGPGEYHEVEDFVIFPNIDRIFITDLKGGRVHIFDLHGRFVDRYRPSYPPFKVNRIGSTLVGLYSYPDFIFNKMHSLHFSDINWKNEEVLIDRANTGITESMHNKIPSTSRSILEYYNDTLTYWEFENDTIYKILNSNTYKIAYILNFPSNDSKKSFTKFSNIIESKKYIFFLQGVNFTKQEIVHCIYNKPSKEISSIKFPFLIKKMQLRGGIINDIDNGWPFLPVGQTNQNELFCYFFKHELDLYLEKRKDVDHKIPEKVLNSKFIDNPVIMLIKL